MSDKKTRSPNDQRADVKNPNNSAYKADQANQEKQAASKGSSTSSGEGKEG